MYVRSEVIMPFMRDRAIASGCSREDQQHCISHLAACSKQGIRWFHGGILITVALDFDGRASGGASPGEACLGGRDAQLALVNA